MKYEGITEVQFARIEKDKRKGFNTRWIVDKHKCPACGSETRYELKPPHFPQVHVCSHVVGLENKSLDPDHPIWVISYNYQVPVTRKKRSEKSRPISTQGLNRLIKNPGKNYRKALLGQTDLLDFFQEMIKN